MVKYLNLLSLLLAAGVMAQDELPDLRVQNPGGTVQDLFEVKLVRVEPDGLRVLHAAGAAKVPYELLPEDLQVKYGFNAAQAQEHRQAAAAVVAAAHAAHERAVAPGYYPPADGTSPTWGAADSTHAPGSNWTDTAAWVTGNNTAFTNNPGSFPSTQNGYDPGYSSYRTPTVARISSSRRSSRYCGSTRYYGSTYNCWSYRSPIYYSAPISISVGSVRPTAAAFGRSRTSSFGGVRTSSFGGVRSSSFGGGAVMGGSRVVSSNAGSNRDSCLLTRR